MKNHKSWSTTIWDMEIYGLGKADALAKIEEAFFEADKAGAVEVTITLDHDYGYGDCSLNWRLDGWVPMTKQEIEKVEAAAKKRKETAAAAKRLEKKKKDEAEAKEYARLHKKFKGKTPA